MTFETAKPRNPFSPTANLDVIAIFEKYSGPTEDEAVCHVHLTLRAPDAHHGD